MLTSIPGYVPAPVLTRPSAWIVWRRRVVQAVSFTVSRAGSSGGVAEDGGWADVAQASATLQFQATDRPVISGALSMPTAGRDIPTLGDPCDVYLGDDRGTRRVLSGVIGMVRGDAASPVIEVTVTDRAKRLTRRITVPPMIHRHPVPLAGHAPALQGAHQVHVLDRVARWCGWWATPQREADAVLSVPGVGSLAPETGVLVHGSTSTGDGAVAHSAAPWGAAVMRANASFEPVVGANLGRALYVRLLVAGEQTSASVTVPLRFSGGETITIRVGESSLTVAYDNGAGVTAQVPWPLPPPAGAQGERDVAVWIDSTGEVWAQADGRQARLIQWTNLVPRVSSLTSVGLVTGDRGALMAGGLQVGHATAPRQLTGDFKRTHLIQTSASEGALLAVPSLVGTTGLELLKDWARCTRSAVWIDEDGRLRCRHRSRLLVQGSSTRVVGARHVTGVQWGTGWATVADRVEVAWRRPTVQATAHPTILVHAESVRLEPRQVTEELLSPPDGEDWVRVDTAIKVLSYVDSASGAADRSQFNSRRDSWVAGVVDNAAAAVTENWIAGASNVAATVEQLDPDTWKIALTAGSLTSTQALDLHVPAEGDFTAGSSRWNAARMVNAAIRGTDGVLIRAKGRTQWADQTATAGPAVAKLAEHQHEAGWWVQSQADADRLAADLLAFMSQQAPVIYDLRMVVPDVRLERYDVLTVQIGGWEARALVLEITDEGTLDAPWVQTLSLQIIP
ncbi:hypothetical protein [Micrococcus sp.]|uniref:hypothetical protein n=1 Tax=Micrococcus sp. TaxID=1271 RepID=UPI002A90D569|nr:hypothetical protein [Micrococcus sp.]MDY6054338.1 hypothetical protein [Micrococcus sp.]